MCHNDNGTVGLYATEYYSPVYESILLEINDGEISYVANKIKLNKTKTNFVIPKGKTISEEEYLKKIREQSGY